MFIILKTPREPPRTLFKAIASPAVVMVVGGPLFSERGGYYAKTLIRKQQIFMDGGENIFISSVNIRQGAINQLSFQSSFIRKL